jgi:glycosyltransferase involved in cell wall biosynthesis
MAKVTFLSADLKDPSARLRILNHRPGLEKAGFEVEVRQLPGGTRGRWSLFRSLGTSDVVVLHRKLFTFLELAFLRRNARRLLFDFDDALWLRVPWRGRSRSRLRTARFRRTVSRSDAVMAGSPDLLAMAGVDERKGLVLPTPVDLAPFPGSGSREDSREVVLGWIGQASSLPYLDQMAPVLERMGKSNPRLRLHVIADAWPTLHGMEVVRVPWTLEGEAEALRGIDIGLAPLSDDDWSRGKCGFKVLQYFAAGKAVVASPVGMNRRLVKDGENGLWAGTPEAWEEKIGILAHDPQLRERFGASGRRLVRESYALEDVTCRLADFLRRFAG